MSDYPLNRFTITEHADGSKTIIHNERDISNLVSQIDVHYGRHDTVVTAQFVGCRVNGDSE